MLSGPHILETALLLLIAFLIGATIGHFARRLTMPKRAAEVVASVAPAVAANGPQLVVAPTIAPVAGTVSRRTAAERLAAAAARDAADADEPVPLRSAEPATPSAAPASAPAEAASSAIQPSRRAGEATSGVVILPPAEILPAPAEAAVAEAPPILEAPQDDTFDVAPVLAEPVAGPVTAATVPQIDEASLVLDQPMAAGAAPVVTIDPAQPTGPAMESPVPIEAAEGAEPLPLAAAQPAPETAPEPLPVAELETIEADGDPFEPEPASGAASVAEVPDTLTEPPPVRRSPAPSRTALEDDEFAAMRAIESGNWTPARRAAAPSRPVPHPEQSAALPEADAAVAHSRSAVEAAAAAAAAVVAMTAELARERRAAAAEILATAPPVAPTSADKVAEESDQLQFEPAAEAAPVAFLETEPARAEPIETSGLVFESKQHAAFGRPGGLPAPREGQADNLKRINGITPQLESSLNALGVYHFDQIAGWDQKAVIWMDNQLALKGRIARDRWLDQARTLSQGRGRSFRPVRR